MKLKRTEEKSREGRGVGREERRVSREGGGVSRKEKEMQ